MHDGMEVPLVFPSLLLHHKVAGNSEVRSAGYCKLDLAGKWITGGRSETLNLSARPQDNEILNAYLGDSRLILSTHRISEKYSS